MRRGISAVAVLVALLAPGTAAATVVASADGYTLHAAHGKGGRICLRLTGPRHYEGLSGCQAAPVSPFRPVAVDHFADTAPIALALPASVTAATLGERRFDTVAVDGFAARFALIPSPGLEPLVRLYDASGGLVGALQPDERFDDRHQGQAVFRARGSAVRVRRAEQLDPNPLELDHTDPESCVTVRVRRSSTASCTLDADLGTLSLTVMPACAPVRPVVAGLVEPSVRAVRLTLGDGRELRAVAQALPAALGPAHLVAVSLPARQAVRRVVALDAGGRIMARQRLGTAPSGLRCAPDDGTSTGFAIAFAGDDGAEAIAAPVAVATVGSHRLLAADGTGTNLCAGFDRRESLQCMTPPVDTDHVFLARRGGAVGGVLAADVDHVDLRLDDGSLVSVPTTDGPAYTGRYAGHVRFVAYAVAAGHRVRPRAVARDAAGRRLGDVYVETPSVVHTLTRPIGGGLVYQRTTYTAAGRTGTQACVHPRHAHSPFGQIGVCGGLRGPNVSVGCTPRRAVIYGILPRGATGVSLHTSAGRLLPHRLRLRDVGRVWLLVLPRSARVSAVDYTGRLRKRFGQVPSHHRPFTVLPAARQCGYDQTTFE